MKKYLKQFGFVALLFVMIVGVSGCAQKNESKESNTKKVSQSKDNENTDEKKEVIEVDENGYWVEYEKPEGWETITNKEYNVSIDVPKDWVETSKFGMNSVMIVNTKSVIMARSPDHRVEVIFALFTINKNLKTVKPEFKLPSENNEMIKKGGNAFKYFRGAYSQDIGVKNDDLIIFYDSLLEDITWDNFIHIGLLDTNDLNGIQDWLTKEEVETIKTIIKSFRKL